MTQKRYSQGIYKPKHPEKYVGDVNRIVYRSSWELRFNDFLDSNPNILRWGSEVVVVPYIKPTDGKVHKYYVDYVIEYQNKDGETLIELIEVKPLNQVKSPRGGKRKSLVYETLTFEINKSKWMAATKFAESKGWKFRIITEQQLFGS
jgi:hypothetical protein